MKKLIVALTLVCIVFCYCPYHPWMDPVLKAGAEDVTCDKDFRVGDEVRSTPQYFRNMSNSFTGIIKEIRQRDGSNDLIIVCIDGKNEGFDEYWLELVGYETNPRIKAIFWDKSRHYATDEIQIDLNNGQTIILTVGEEVKVKEASE